MIVNHVVSCQYVYADRSCESHIVELQVNDTFDIFLRCLATGKSGTHIELTRLRARQSRERKKNSMVSQHGSNIYIPNRVRYLATFLSDS